MSSQSLRSLAGPALMLVGLTLVALFTRPIAPIDETRYVSVAWEMWSKQEYLVLFKNGEPYSHKPPLLFWLVNIGWMIFGVSEVWPRLVLPLFSLGCLLLTLSIARRLWPNALDTHRNALWILGASLLWMVFSTSIMFDVMLTFFVLLGIRGLLTAAYESMTRGFFWLALAIGFGVLAKGPVVLLHLLPVAMLAPWWHLGLSWKRWYVGILLAVLGGATVALCWAVPAAIHGGDEYRQAIFWGQTANRMVDSFAHKEPFWWYLPLLPLLLFPWFLWTGLWKRFFEFWREGTDRSQRFCIAWMVPVFIAFSLISGKRVHYLVPLFPAFALFAARLAATGRPSGVWLPALISSSTAAGMIYFGVVGLPGHLRGWAELPSWPGVALLVLSVGAIWWGRPPPLRVPALAVLSAGVFALAQLYIANGASRGYDLHPMAQAIKAQQEQGVQVAHLGKYHAQFQFVGRLTQPLAEVEPPALNGWLNENPGGAMVAYFDHQRTLPKQALFSQRYRGGTAVLLSSSQALEQFDVVIGSDRKASASDEN